MRPSVALPALAVTLALGAGLTGCGGSADPAGPTPAPAADAPGTSAPGREERGSVRLRLLGGTSDLAVEACDRVALPDPVLSVKAGGLSFSLPPEPGAFSAGDAGVLVVLPDRGSGVVHTNSTQAHGTWSLNGAQASGTLEGRARAVGAGKDAHFVIDFACRYQQIS
jgi:hypothetical protein